jgi:hypothetical protein
LPSPFFDAVLANERDTLVANFKDYRRHPLLALDREC